MNFGLQFGLRRRGRVPLSYKSYLFDGVDDYINSGDILDYTATDFSIGFWIKPTTVALSNVMYRKSGGLSVDGYWLETYGSYFGLITNQSGTYQVTQAAEGTLTAGEWQHFMFVRTGTSVKIYKNNVEVSYYSQGIHASPLTSSSDLLIGKENNYLSGNLSRIASYSKALDVDERTLLFNKGLPPTSLDLYYLCNEGSGIVAVDGSGNGRDGDLISITESEFHSLDGPA